MRNQPRNRNLFNAGGILLMLSVFTSSLHAQQQSFTLEQVMSAPFPSDLAVAKSAPRVAWVFDEQGKRNIYVAEAPDFKTRRLTSYLEEDGQELSSLQFSSDASTIVYTRGGPKNRAGQSPDPTSNPAGAQQTIYQISWRGGEPQKIDLGDDAQISSKGACAYVRDGALWLAALDGKEKPEQLFIRGTNAGQRWSPDGSKLLFVSVRGDHSFIGVYDVSTKSVRFIAPSVDSDTNAEWSLDGKQIAFVRRPAVPRDTPEGVFIEPDRPRPWAIWVVDVATSNTKEIWHSGKELQDSFPYMADDTGGGAIHWAANNTIVFASEQDGWQHLYAETGDSTAPKLLTPGNCEVEQWSFSADAKTIFFNSNCDDIDRRHVWSVGFTGPSPQPLTTGQGIEWSPAAVSSTTSLVYFASDAQHPARPHVVNLAEPRSAARPLAPDTWPSDFPAPKLDVPRQMVFKTACATVSAQELEPRRKASRYSLFSRRSDSPDAAGLALHVLLLKFLRDEPVSCQPRIRRACRELSQRHRLRPRLPRSSRPRRTRGQRVSGCRCRGKISSVARRSESIPDRPVGRQLRRLPDGARTRAKFRPLRRRRGYARCARLAHG